MKAVYFFINKQMKTLQGLMHLPVLPQCKEEDQIVCHYMQVINDLDDKVSDNIKKAIIIEGTDKLKKYNQEWTSKDLQRLISSKLPNKSKLIPIPKISSVYLNEYIETRGIVVHKKDHYFILQETSNDIETRNITSFNIHCYFKDIEQIQEESYIAVFGYPRYSIRKGAKVNTLYIEAINIKPITKEKAILDNERTIDTFFTEENLKMETDTSDELISTLKAHANEEGFNLVIAKKESTRASLLCYMHCKRQKTIELNTDCKFFINLTKIKKNGIIPRFVWHVSTFSLDHNHTNDPFTFIHKTLSPGEKKLIISMLQNGVGSTQIAKIFLDSTHKFLSSAQISLIGKTERRNLREDVAQSEELKEYMKSNNGIFYYPPSNRITEKIEERTMMATFTQQEFDNLKKYGDFVSIDPTFCEMSSNWSIIPLTVIGCECNIKCAGLVFACSTASETFHWILKLLVQELPCKDKIETICSDDDVGLECAFMTAKMCSLGSEVNSKIAKLNRVICFWHKIQNFIKFIKTLHLPEDEEERFIHLFRVMGMTRDEKLSRQYRDELNENDAIRTYIEANIDEKLEMSAKSLINYFTCGYNTSSISESINNRLKRTLPKRPLTLKEIREHLTFMENNSMYNKRYYKTRKERKVKSSDVVNIMSKFNISEPIANEIIGSFEKAERLGCIIHDDDLATITDNKYDNTADIQYTEEYLIFENNCSCHKQESKGIPCSHLIKYLQETGQDVLEIIQVADRWKLDYIQYFDTPTIPTNPVVEHEETDFHPSNEKERFVHLRSRSNSLVSIASKSEQSFNLMNSIFDTAE